MRKQKLLQFIELNPPHGRTGVIGALDITEWSETESPKAYVKADKSIKDMLETYFLADLTVYLSATLADIELTVAAEGSTKILYLFMPDAQMDERCEAEIIVTENWVYNTDWGLSVAGIINHIMKGTDELKKAQRIREVANGNLPLRGNGFDQDDMDNNDIHLAAAEAEEDVALAVIAKLAGKIVT